MFAALGTTKVSLTQNSRVQEQLRKHYGAVRCSKITMVPTTEKWSYARADRFDVVLSQSGNGRVG
ncbi:hypothetical protein [Aeromonas caviae]|uniref:hypothetical protein n=1 Tax=Aeromonas caviae TaxID=648 RepID=UPI0011AE4D80|nr:hypothetical protein [Aeromonas caviae]